MRSARSALIAVAGLTFVCFLPGCSRQQPPDATGAAAPSQPATGDSQPTAPSPQPSTAFDWPAFRGPNADGISPVTGINKNWQEKKPRVLWKVGMSDGGYAGPSVANGKVFIIDHKGDEDIVRALDIRNGKEAWRLAYPDTGKENYGFARATPVYSEGKLYTLSRLGLLYCLDASNGNKQWSRDLVDDFGGKGPTWDYAMSPLVDGDKLILCPGGQTGVAALDKSSGDDLWTGGAPGPPGYATPVAATLAGRKQYVVFAGTKLFAVDPDSGKTLWQLPWKTNHDVNAATPVVIDDFLFITSNYGVGCGLVQVSAGSARAFWSNKTIQSHFNAPVYYNRFIYGISNHLACLNPQDGKTMWKQAGFEKGGLVCVDGVIIAIGGNTGEVVMATATHTGYQELGRIKPLGGQSWTPPIVADGKLIIRNKKTLACVDLM